MAIMMLMNWNGVKAEEYEQLRKSVNWEGNKPTGAISHFSAFSDSGIHVVDLWERAEDFNSFVQNRLMPEVQKLGVNGEPKIDIYPLHATYTPGFSK